MEAEDFSETFGTYQTAPYDIPRDSEIRALASLFRKAA
jgi:hypothetical protein